MLKAIAAAMLLVQPASAADGYFCQIHLSDHFAQATLFQEGGTWRLVDEDGKTSIFDEISVPHGEALYLVSQAFDRDAAAVAMMTVARDGRAFLSLHGFFPTFDAITYPGTCETKDD